VWVLDDEAAGVTGQTVVQRQGPPFGWTDAERAEPALYLSGPVTDPAAMALRPGSLMAWWAWTWPPVTACHGYGGMPRSRRSRRMTRPRVLTWYMRSSVLMTGSGCWRGRPSGSICRRGSARVQARNARAAWSRVITSTSFDHGSSQ
jgi:hypothetical protein